MIIYLALTSLASQISAGEEKYLFRENVQIGQRITGDLTCQGHTKRTTTADGKTTTDDYEYRQYLKTAFTVLSVREGSATEMKVDVDPESYDITKSAGESDQRTPCAFAGKTVTIRRRADETVANDFKDDADPSDVENLNSLLNPDEDFFPDHAVAVGDTWDVSAKLSKHAELGPGDQLLAQCRLDWVKEIGGKKIAQISCSEGTILHEEDNVEEDIECSTTSLVDVAANQIVQCDQKGSSKFLTVAGNSTQTTGGGEFSFVGRVIAPSPTSRP